MEPYDPRCGQDIDRQDVSSGVTDAESDCGTIGDVLHASLASQASSNTT